MGELLKDETIVQNISKRLSVLDYLSFSAISTKIGKVLEKSVDLEYFQQRLSHTLIVHDPYYTEDLLLEVNSTNCFNIHKTNNPKGTIARIATVLRPYLLRIFKNVDVETIEFEMIFDSNTISSQDEAKILVNLEKFIILDDADEEYHDIMLKKIRTIIRTFTKHNFDDMVENFHKGEYSIVNLLVETLNVLDQEDLIVEFFKQENKFPMDFFPDTVLTPAGELSEESINDVVKDLTEFFNNKSRIIDESFKQQLPVMLMYAENIIDKNVTRFITEESEKNLQIIPVIYLKLLNEFVPNLIDSHNAGPSYREMIERFINLYVEPLVERFLDEDLVKFKQDSIAEIKKFEKEVEEQDKIDQENIYKSVLIEYNNDEVKTNKFELLTSFTKIFNKSNKESNEIKFKVNFEILNKNLQNLKSFINFELSCQIIGKAKEEVELTGTFNKIENSIITRARVNQQIEEIFITLVTILSQEHLKPGFSKAIDLLSKYEPTEFKSLENIEQINTVEPLVKFTELINVGDLIQQMVEIFYENELVQKKIVEKNEFLNNANQAKKQFETTLDTYVANGLNIGIDKLMDEIEFLFNTLQLVNDFNPKSSDVAVLSSTGPTKCAIKVCNLLSNHINLLNGTTEKGVIDIFQQEIGERFFRMIVKNIKKRMVSTTGSIILISDLNLYYDFIINTLRQKNINPLFAALKEIGQLYLISTEDSKELGKLIGDLTKFNGVFKQEEIYEFVQRRADWLKIKKDVEKAMYGLGLVDCVIM